MRCFSVQKPKRRSNGGEQAGKPDDISVESETSPRPVLPAPPSFKSRVKAIQNAQRFINSNPKLRSSHPSYGSRESRDAAASTSSLVSPPIPLGGRARSATELGSSLLDVATAYKSSQAEQMATNIANCIPTPTPMPMPMPLPSPQPSLQLNAYRLPLPSEHANGVSPPLTSPTLISPKLNSPSLNYRHTISSAATTAKHRPSPTGHHTTSSSSSSSTTTTTTIQIGQLPNGNPSTSSSSTADNSSGLTKAKVFVSELQPLPPPKEAILVPGLRSFEYKELASACQNFCRDCSMDDADGCFAGTIKVHGKTSKHQDVVVVRIQETWQQQGFLEWLSELSKVSRQHSLHVCKLVGFYGEDGSTEHMLVYEKLQKGSLSTLLFEASDVPPLDWPTRMKIAYGAAQGLASLHEKCSEQVLYRDFRSSSIQVDADYSSKISSYRFVNTLEAENYTSPNNPRVNAYRAPETVSAGEVTLKSNVWSYGVVLLELLSGKQNMDERMTKDEKHNLVKWAKPFLKDEGRLFLIMDPKLQGRFPSKGAKMIADVALQCMQKDPIKRPTMKEVLDMVKCVQEMRYTKRFPLKEPTKSSKFPSSVSSPLPSAGPYVGTSLSDQKKPSNTRSPTKFDLIESPPLRPLIIPSQRCASTFAMEDMSHHQQDYPSAPLGRVTGF